MARKKKEDKEEPNKVSKKLSTSDIVIAQFSKKYGGAVIDWLSSAPEIPQDIYPTGSLGLDAALGGGFYAGINEIYGEQSGGKSTLALFAIASMHRHDPESKCIYIDAEKTLDRKLAESYGVDPDRLLLVRGYGGPANLEMLEELLNSRDYRMAVIDSISALIPDNEVDASMTDSSQIGAHARLISRAVTRLSGVTFNTNSCLIAINQLRTKFNKMFATQDTTGGQALKYYAITRVQVDGSAATKSGRLVDPKDGAVIGHKCKFTVVKNKRGVPWRTAYVDLIYGMGYDTVGEVVDIGTDLGVLTKNGNWFAYEGNNVANGRDNTIEVLREDTELYESIYSKLKPLLGVGEYRGASVEENEGVEEERSVEEDS